MSHYKNFDAYEFYYLDEATKKREKKTVKGEYRRLLYDILFDLDKATLQPESTRQLMHVVTLLKDNPERIRSHWISQRRRQKIRPVAGDGRRPVGIYRQAHHGFLFCAGGKQLISSINSNTIVDFEGIGQKRHLSVCIPIII